MSKDEDYFDSTAFPAIFICLDEHYLTISIAITPSRVVVDEVLKLELRDSVNRGKTIRQLARAGSAVASCSDALFTYYQRVGTRHDTDLVRVCFPNPTHDSPDVAPGLEYKGFLSRYYSVVSEFSDPSPLQMRSIFVAEVKNDKNDGNRLVKFTTAYCAEAHRILAEKGLAPKLYHCGRVVGDMFMVVMEHLSDYKRLEDFETRGRLANTLIEDLQRALHELHSQGFVHGDFRAANIMVSPKADHAKVIDFDWAAKEDEGRYCESINKEELHYEWHEEVNAGKPMKKEHDDRALEIILRKCTT